MDQGSILRQGVWYHQKADGSWLRYNGDTSSWEPTTAPPPPTPPPVSPTPVHASMQSGPTSEQTALPSAFTEPDTKQQKVARSSYMKRYGKASRARVNPLVAVAVVLGLLVVAVGGAFASGMFDAEETETPSLAAQPTHERKAAPKPLKKEAFLAKADALCGVANSQMDAMTVPTSFDPMYLTEVIQINTRLVRNLRQLPPPRKDERKIDRMLTHVERALGYMILTVKSAREGSAVTASRSLTRAQTFASHANKIAKAYGLEECSEPA